MTGDHRQSNALFSTKTIHYRLQGKRLFAVCCTHDQIFRSLVLRSQPTREQQCTCRAFTICTRRNAHARPGTNSVAHLRLARARGYHVRSHVHEDCKECDSIQCCTPSVGTRMGKRLRATDRNVRWCTKNVKETGLKDKNLVCLGITLRTAHPCATELVPTRLRDHVEWHQGKQHGGAFEESCVGWNEMWNS